MRTTDTPREMRLPLPGVRSLSRVVFPALVLLLLGARDALAQAGTTPGTLPPLRL